MVDSLPDSRPRWLLVCVGAQILGGLYLGATIPPLLMHGHLAGWWTSLWAECGEQGLAYDERGLVASYRIVLRELRARGQQRDSGSPA
jgi:hypothetical protein